MGDLLVRLAPGLLHFVGPSVSGNLRQRFEQNQRRNHLFLLPVHRRLEHRAHLGVLLEKVLIKAVDQLLDTRGHQIDTRFEQGNV